MLRLIFAESGCGKTEYVFNEIKKLAEKGCKDILLITPEQFSLVSERRLLSDLGESGVSAVENSSFTRICDDVRRKLGSQNLPVLSKGGKAVLMMKAIELCRNELKLFSRQLDSVSFVGSMVRIYDEMKSCNLTAAEIREKSINIKNDTLKRKMEDISSIISAYELLLKDRYFDSADELTRLYNKLSGLNYFKGRYVFIDGFNGFVAQEYKLLELIIKEAECVTLTLCTDNPDSTDSFSLFGYVNNSARIITKIAEKANVKIIEKRFNKNMRAKNPEMLYLAENVLREGAAYSSDVSNIQIYSAKNVTDECSQAAREIRKMLKGGFKAREIAVIVRDINKYREEAAAVFKKYEIPFFSDERQPIKNQPLIVFIEYLLRCVNFSLRSDDILSLAKTGLTQIADEDINLLENYIFTWSINGLKWTTPFENSPKGFVSEISDSDRKLLAAINEARQALISPILSFKNKVKGADTKTVCAQIYYTLIKFGADKKLVGNAVELSDLNQTVLAREQGRIWDITMDILNILPQIIDDDKISLKDFAKIFSLVISTEDLGTLPAGIDNIQFGQADRIRTDNPRAVFILGADEGEFPQSAGSSGLLSESDRRILLDNDFKLYSYGEILNLQERYFAYMACSAPSEKLFISYTGNNGRNSSPSEIVTSVASLFPVKERNINDISDIDLVQTKQNAFELMCERYFYTSAFYSSLKEVFADSPLFEAVKELAENKDASVKNLDLSEKLFNRDMYVSASRVEDFYNCPFRYFCKFGLNARPAKKAEIDPLQRGTLIHFVLEMIMSQVGSKRLSSMNEREIKELVDKFTAEYFETEMGGATDLSERFKYNYKRLSKLIYSVVLHLSQEFADSQFEAKAFELNIDRDGAVKPEILPLENGGSIQIRGSIDRVDTYELNGRRYVRVVDYKSGSKSFNLSDIMHGLNLQMFIYLFALCEDKTAELTGDPAGVLYMHAARNVFSFDSKSSAQKENADEENASFKMKGIVLDDENGDIARAMENNLAGKYIPVKVKKDGELTGKLAKAEELGYIHKKINSLVAEMGNELHGGYIARFPVRDKNHKHTCEYCDYRDVCAAQRSINNRNLAEISDEQVKEQLAKEFGE